MAEPLKFTDNNSLTLKRRVSNSSLDNKSSHSQSRDKQSNIFHGHKHTP